MRSVEIDVEERHIEQTKQDLITEFKNVFDGKGPLPDMKGQPPMVIELNSDPVPYAVNGARPIPFAQRETVKQMLDDMVQQEIITPVTEPTDWAHPLVIVAKPNGKLRQCVDLTKLNKHVKRPFYPLVTPKDVVSNIGGRIKYISTLDATHGYWQTPLEEKSRILTTFITPWGRFKFMRGTMGLISTGDEYCRRMDAALGHLPNIVKVDDLLCYGDQFDKHVKDMRTLLETCRENKITLNKAKFQFARKKAKFAGYIVSRDGVEADPDKVDTIAKFSRPENVTQMRSFMGLVQ